MIVQTASPLVAAEGAAVTTAAIAAAAGVGEATIFRVFPDKEELLDSCLPEALRPDNALATIALDQPLLARLAEATEALAAHVDRMGRVLGAMQASGYRAGRLVRTGRCNATAVARPVGRCPPVRTFPLSRTPRHGHLDRAVPFGAVTSS